jgi:hypothetical protein
VPYSGCIQLYLVALLTLKRMPTLGEACRVLGPPRLHYSAPSSKGRCVAVMILCVCWVERGGAYSAEGYNRQVRGSPNAITKGMEACRCSMMSTSTCAWWKRRKEKTTPVGVIMAASTPIRRYVSYRQGPLLTEWIVTSVTHPPSSSYGLLLLPGRVCLADVLTTQCSDAGLVWVRLQ